jgi:glucosamine-6-phosphate deaminase
MFPDAGALGAALARDIVTDIANASCEGRRYLLGCPGGRSLLPTYESVAAWLRQSPIDLSHVVVVMMDDYLDDRPGPPRRISPDALHSCERFGTREIAEPWSRAVNSYPGIAEGHVWLPDPDEPGRYDERIAEAGGVDLFLLATGASDGHVAFNPPGADLNEGTRVITLADTTRRDNLVTFPHLAAMDKVPRRGISVGLATIARLSHRVRLVATGRAKAASAARLLAADAWQRDWPATVVHACRDAELWLDRAAAGPTRR